MNGTVNTIYYVRDMFYLCASRLHLLRTCDARIRHFFLWHFLLLKLCRNHILVAIPSMRTTVGYCYFFFLVCV